MKIWILILEIIYYQDILSSYYVLSLYKLLVLPVNDQVSLGKGRTFNEEIGARKGNFSQISRLSMKNQISTRVEYLDIGLTTRLFFFFCTDPIKCCNYAGSN